MRKKKYMDVEGYSKTCYILRRFLEIMETDKMSMYSVWVDTSEKVASFHMVESGDFIHFLQQEDFMAYLSTLTTQGYRFQ